MRAGAVVRNYAEALLDVARRHDAVERYGVLLDAVAGAVAVEPRLQAVLASPRILKERKKRLLRDALAGYAPPPFVRFLEAVVQRGRQGLLADISREFEVMVDAHLGRVHAGVATAHDVEADQAAAITAALTRLAGKEVLAHFRTDQRLLGGVVVRMGDRVFDGSLRRRLLLLRHRMLHSRTGGGA